MFDFREDQNQILSISKFGIRGNISEIIRPSVESGCRAGRLKRAHPNDESAVNVTAKPRKSRIASTLDCLFVCLFVQESK